MKLKLPPYILFNDSNNNPTILQTEWPHYCAHVLNSRMENLSQYFKSIPLHFYIANSVVAGYNISVYMAGTITGNVIPYSIIPTKEYQDVANAMASWYLIEVIGKDLEKYSRFAL